MICILRAMALTTDRHTGAAPVQGWAPFALGFRPFFLLGALAAVLLMVVWTLLWHGVLAAPAHYDPVAWHGHEMLFGYTVAVIAGFLLTAVRNWTGIQTWTGPRLAMLAALWLLGRLLPWMPGVPAVLVVAVDVAFLPLVLISLVHPLWQGQNRVNRVFLPLLAAMALANLLSHLQLLDVVSGLGDMRRVMLDLILLIIALVAGRVMPFFTQNVLPGFQSTQRPWVERLTMVLLVLLVIAQAIPASAGVPTGLLWLAFAGSQAVRMAGWFERRIFTIPVLWVLHVGYAWLVLGAVLSGIAELGLFAPASALHALTAGAVGVFTMGMMARVARGHSGRSIDVTRVMTAAFVVMNLAALIRVFGTAWGSATYARWVDLSALLWIVGFALFVWQYASILLRPRVDGKPG
ncbi:MAG TPA: NnrS family protein [Gammaproteobacteria bacterium]|nr:NnrS family protein [Gammaproteobacteria bacterium]